MMVLQVDLSRVDTVCSLMQSLLCGMDPEKPVVDFKMDPAKLNPFLCTMFVFCYVWGMGGNLVETSMDGFDSFCRDLFGENSDAKIPGGADLYSYFVDMDTKRMELWEKSIPSFTFDPEVGFYYVLF